MSVLAYWPRVIEKLSQIDFVSIDLAQLIQFWDSYRYECLTVGSKNAGASWRVYHSIEEDLYYGANVGVPVCEAQWITATD